jgi:hypothetical protein
MSQRISDDIRHHATTNYVSSARRSRKQEFEIVVGDVHRDLRMRNRVPQVSAALRSKKFLRENHLDLVGESGPPSGMSTTTRLKYRFQDEELAGASPALAPGASPLRGVSIYQRIRELYGIAGELYRSIGGSEHALCEERERFYGSTTGLDPSEPRPK